MAAAPTAAGVKMPRISLFDGKTLAGLLQIENSAASLPTAGVTGLYPQSSSACLKRPQTTSVKAFPESARTAF